MEALVDFLADLSKLPPAAIVAIGLTVGLLFALVLIVTIVRCGFRYLEHRVELAKQRGQDQLIQAFMFLDGHKAPGSDKFVHAIRGNAIADAKAATDAEPLVDPEISGALGQVIRMVQRPPGPD